jgi:hypothetical protein
MKKGLLIIFSGLLAFSACRKDPYRADLPDNTLDLKILRLEEDLFTLDLDSIAEKVPWFREKYGEFFDLYNTRVINIGGSALVTYPEYLTIFLTDYLNNEVYHKTMETFPDLTWLEEELSKAFSRYHYLFPGRQIPALYSYISRFNQSIVIADSVLAIGLDKYLGTDCEYYRRLGLYSYLIKNMHPDKILSDCISSWCLTEFIYNDSVDNVLSNILYNGKILYLTKTLLPGHPDSLITGFTGEEMQFCRANEARMWEYMIENKILFVSDAFTIKKYTGIGPFTADFTDASPARAAVWIGWRIIEDYAARNPDVTIQEIIADNDYQKILALSRYNP